ncbi:AUGMIN subunit 8-like [Salvia splendens]|uniref:AUGMIN subunit 8-like n=1 Tax=Salvia splendens TaxID=180675 RepID=UPI001C28148E|nr:AUGMIN subunit 8-like [Salvia splendens]
MDVYEEDQAIHKQSAADRTRLPLVSTENKNGVTRSRYRSSSPTKRWTPSTSTHATSSKRAISAERNRPSRPSSPRSPSTPIQDTSAGLLLASRKVAGNKMPEALWPSTTRSQNVSLQPDTFFIPVSKKEKPVSYIPERKQTPLEGMSSADQSENSKPVDSLYPRMVDQHRWPSTTAGKVSTILSTSNDMSDKTTKTLSSTCTETGTPSPRIVSMDGKSKRMLVSCYENGRELVDECSVDDFSTPIARSDSSSSSDRTQMSNAAAKHMAAPALGLLSTVSKWIIPTRGKAVNSSGGSSPARKRPSSPARKRPSSPAWIRPSSPTRKLPSAASVFSFLTDIKHGKKAKHIEDVHNLRLLYNRLLQWRYANARSDDALQSQKVKTEKVLSSVWMEIVAVWDSIIEKRIEIQKLKLKLKLYTILDNQICGLEEWKSTEMDHISSLSWAIEDLQAGTVLVPVIRGARGSIQKIKEAVSLAVDVMQAMGSSLRSVLLKVNRMHSLASDLADVVIEGRAIFDEYESLLISIAELQVEESSLRTHLLQMKPARSNDETSIYGY